MRCNYLRESGADAVAIARGSLGNPWIFSQARALLGGAAAVRGPTPAERGRVLMQLVEGEFRFYGPPLALRRLPAAAATLPNFCPRRRPFGRQSGR